LAKKIWVDSNEDGADWCGFQQCMAWTAMSVDWTMEGGTLSPRLLGHDARHGRRMGGGFSFVLISDTHIGFDKEANQDVAAMLQNATTRINELSTAPELLAHNGDSGHLSKPSAFDNLEQDLRSANAKQSFFVPVSTDRKFTVLIMDTEQCFSFTFKEPGSYPYFCKILPVMTGGVLVVCGVS
jgi:3',5'-cyclic-AMP phosphodiesterase